MTTKTTNKEPTPNGAKLEVTILIDQDMWDELVSQGYSEHDLHKMIEKSICLDRIGEPHLPVFDIEDVTLLRYC